MQITPVCQLPGEATLLRLAINDFSHSGPQSHYADWMEGNGDAERANTVRATIRAYHALNDDEFETLAGEANWQHMVAIPVLKHLIESRDFHPREELETLRDLVFPRLCAAVTLKY